MRLILFHPEFDRSCEDCGRWMYDDEGKVELRPARTGLPVLRPAHAATPCHKCPKIPEGAEPRRQEAVELSEQNRRAYLHYLECRAVQNWPDDPIVRHNARLIRAVMDAYERAPLNSLLAILGSAKR